MFERISIKTTETAEGLAHAEVTGEGLSLSITAPADEIWRTISTLSERVTFNSQRP